MLAQAQFLTASSAYLTDSKDAVLTLQRLTGQESVSVFVGFSGLDYSQGSPVIPINIVVESFETQ